MRKGRTLEQVVERLEQILGHSDQIEVKSPDLVEGRVSGRLREIDVSLRGQVGSTTIFVMVECRERTDTADVTWIEQLVSKREDVAADKAVAVSTSGFSSSARRFADAKGIELRTVEEIGNTEVSSWLGVQEATLEIHEAKHVRTEIELDPPRPISGARELTPDLRRAVALEKAFAKVLRQKADGRMLSILDVWQLVPDAVWIQIERGAAPQRRRVEVDVEGVQVETTAGLVDVSSISFQVELSIT